MRPELYVVALDTLVFRDKGCVSEIRAQSALKLLLTTFIQTSLFLLKSICHELRNFKRSCQSCQLGLGDVTTMYDIFTSKT